MVALAAVPLFGMVALAVDFGQMTVVQSKLDFAADSAALLASTVASNALKSGDVNVVQKAIAAGQARFAAQTANQTNVMIGSVNVALTQNGGLFNASVAYTAQTPTTFARVLGIDMLSISGQSTASLSLNPFVDIQILMDASSSMTLAATPAAMTAMSALTAKYRPPAGQPVPGNVSVSCTFACHWSTTGDDYYKLALKNNVQLRITVLQMAVGNLINKLLDANSSNRFRLGLYSFNQKLNVLFPLNSDVADAMGSLSTIAPSANFCSNDITCPDTYFSNAMEQLRTLPMPSPQQADLIPQRFLFLVSDGVYDQWVSGQREIGAFNPADCAALKAMGVSILVLYTPYTAPTPTNSYYVQRVQPEAGQIEPNLKACASSPSYFFIASDATGIDTQLQNMLQLVVQTTSHLTN